MDSRQVLNDSQGMTKGVRVFCIGETVLDIIFKENRPIAANPGGSMLNSAVSLGRAGIPVYFISDFAMDHAGEVIHSFLLQNGVSTKYISRYTDGKTALALAFLDNRQDAEYSFYKIFPENRLNLEWPAVEYGDIILFGSFYALTESIRAKIIEFIRCAKSNGAFVMYDPNFRTAHLMELPKLRPWILENISMADLVRGSDEDFLHIFGVSDAKQAFQHVSGAGCPLLVYTRNRESIEVISAGYSQAYEVPKIKPLSTIGAGDAFNAGIIYALSQAKRTLQGIRVFSWEEIIDYGIRFSADVCQSLDNFVSVDFGNHVKKNPEEY